MNTLNNQDCRFISIIDRVGTLYNKEVLNSKEGIVMQKALHIFFGDSVDIPVTWAHFQKHHCYWEVIKVISYFCSEINQAKIDLLAEYAVYHDCLLLSELITAIKLSSALH